MRNTIVALAAAAGMLVLAPLTASAAPSAAVPQVTHATAIQQADWACGPRCRYWRHRRWEHARREHWRWEHRHYGWRHTPHHEWYGYNYGYR